MIYVVIQMQVNMVVTRVERLIIDKQSSLPRGLGPPSAGHWTSHSKYLGQYTGGKYLLRNWHLEQFGPSRGGSLADPVGWFIDSNNWDAPFLILSNFDQRKGIGKLLRISYPDLPSLASDTVDWFKAS